MQSDVLKIGEYIYFIKLILKIGKAKGGGMGTGGPATLPPAPSSKYALASIAVVPREHLPSPGIRTHDPPTLQKYNAVEIEWAVTERSRAKVGTLPSHQLL